jgi:hypothetical protein
MGEFLSFYKVSYFSKSLLLIKHFYNVKKWCVYMVEYYSVIKKNEIMSFSGKWLKLKKIKLSKISQTNITCYLSYAEARFLKIYESRKGTF